MDTKQIVLDIAMNLNRIGNWVADGYEKNSKKINTFIDNTDSYIDRVKINRQPFKRTWDTFLENYSKYKLNISNNAENFMTWGNILTHRSKHLEMDTQ